MKRNIGIAVAAVLLIGFFVWRAQPQQVVKRKSKELIGMADQVGGGVGLFDFSNLETLLDAQIEFEVEAVSRERETVGSVEVISAYQWLGENVKKSEFEISSFDSIQINGDQATVKTQVEGLLEMEDIRMLDGTYFVEFGWRKDEKGDWRLTELIWK